MSINLCEAPDYIADLCRVCLHLPEESQYLDLTTIYDEEENLTYGECFTFCTQIDLTAGDDVPHHLCKPCGLELQMCYDFYKKIEESKRAIEQYQNQLKVHEDNASGEQSKDLILKASEERDVEQIIEEKYIIIEEQQLPERSEATEECCVNQHEPLDMNEEADEREFLKTLQVSSHENDSSAETMNHENNVRIEVENHLLMEDYHNLEALEEEETETLQIKCDESNIATHVTKYKIIASGANKEYVEYAGDYDEEEVKEEERDVLDEDYVHVINEADTEDHLRWQENVVTVANKEHLPIVIESDEEKEENLSIVYKICETQTPTNESSQDHDIENAAKTAKTKSNANKSNNTDNNNKGRKRHVGSFSCDYCQRVYPNYSRMKTHRRCHEVDRPKFSCSQCGRMYATKQARDCHIQTAHDKSGYTCTICSKVFAIRKSLEIHVRYHTGDFPYSCSLCDRKFAQACHLNTHINVKHNKIRFSCEYPSCGKCFTSSSSLRNHEYTHGVMPFECEYCQQGYPAKSKLRVHIKCKHGFDLTTEQLENMRKFHVMRSKVNLVRVVET